LVFFPLVAFILVHNYNNPLGAGMNMDVLDPDRLAVSSRASIEGLEQVVLKFDQFVGVDGILSDAPIGPTNELGEGPAVKS
jgi:hypothetical protein